MITYKTQIAVYLENKFVGTIYDEGTAGAYYLPNGFNYKVGVTKIYPSVLHCKRALESEA